MSMLTINRRDGAWTRPEQPAGWTPEVIIVTAGIAVAALVVYFHEYRARHIHFVITHAAHKRLITRIFFKGDENIDEAPYPELAVFLEESLIDGDRVFYADLEFVLLPN
jgi:protocatechuate 3,4-dioxygenase beta subunit